MMDVEIRIHCAGNRKFFSGKEILHMIIQTSINEIFIHLFEKCDGLNFASRKSKLQGSSVHFRGSKSRRRFF